MGAGGLSCSQAAGKAEVPKHSSTQGNNFPIIGFQRVHGTIQAGRVLRKSPSQPPAQSRVSCDQVAQLRASSSLILKTCEDEGRTAGQA